MPLLLAAAAALVDPAPAAPLHNYLRGAEPPERCGGRRAGGDIVVCGREQADEPFRLRPLPDAERYDPRPLRAEAKVFGGAKLGVHGGAAEVGGIVSNRAMVTLSVPF